MLCCLHPDCQNLPERNGYCPRHNRENRKAETDALKVKKKYVIPKTSPKMKQELKTYSVLRKEYLKKHPECQLKLIGCVSEATDIHHLDKRGKNLNNTDTWLSACRPCHSTLHDKLSAKEARDLGLKK
jgi:hypothetical protein